VIAEPERIGRMSIDIAAREMYRCRRVAEGVVQLVGSVSAAEPGSSFSLGMEEAVALDPAVGFGACEEVGLVGTGMAPVPEPGYVPVTADQKTSALGTFTVCRHRRCRYGGGRPGGVA